MSQQHSAVDQISQRTPTQGCERNVIKNESLKVFEMLEKLVQRPKKKKKEKILTA